MKFIIQITLLVVLTSTKLYAQPSEITGKIVDENEVEIPFATVALYHVTSDTNMVKATFSDEKGVFSFNGFKIGKYFLEASFVGFSKSKTAIINFDGKSKLEIPNLRLTSQAKILEGVEVKAERELVEVKPDKTVFNVQGSINATGNTALELLIKSPGVIVDNNDNLILQGKTGVQIYIDGKRSPLRGEDLANYLKTLQSNEIDALEIITEPSAKYDAEGNAGIINIRLIKDKSIGTNGSVNLGLRYGINPKYNGSVSFNNRNKKVNTFGSFSVFDGKNESNIDVYRIREENIFDQDILMVADNSSYGYKFGTDFFLSKNSTLGVLVNGNINENTENTNSNIDISNFGTNVTDSLLVASNDINSSRNNTNFNINYSFNNGKGSSLNIDLDYGRFRNTSTSFQPNTYYLPDESTIISQNIYSLLTPTDIDIYTGKIDWENNVFGGKLSLGAKSSFVTTDNTFDSYDVQDGEKVKDHEKSNNFVYDEFINAVYVSFQKKLSDKWNINTGLRMEHTNSEGTLTTTNSENNEPPVAKEYVSWFPNAGITYQLNTKNNFKLSYSRRVDRPNYQNLNPFETRVDELTFRKGNPFLNPQFANSISFSHTYKSLLNTSLNYTVINDRSAPIVKRLDENQIILTIVNLTKQTNLGLTVSYPFSVNDWWNIYGTFTAFRLRNEAIIDGQEIDLTTNSFKFFAQNTFTVSDQIKIEVSGWYNSPALWGGNLLTGSQYDVTIGVSKQILNKRGNFKLSLSDIFLTNPWSTESDFDNIYTEGKGRWESRQIRFNFSYRFGSNTVKNNRSRKTGLEDLKKRAASNN